MPTCWAAVKGNEAKTAWKTDKGGPVYLDKAPAHKSVVAIAAVHDCGFELIDHPHYSADWHHWTIFCAGKRYQTADKVKSTEKFLTNNPRDLTGHKYLFIYFKQYNL